MPTDDDPTPDRARVPLWRQILTDLEQRLARGEFAERFPTDRELVARYGTSRHTVREAVRHLKARGVIERERGRGSVVTPGHVTQQLGALYNLFDAVERAGHTQRSEVLTLDLRTDAAIAERFGYDSATPLVHLERIRYLDDEPLALDTVWLASDIGQPLLDTNFERTSLYGELARHTGVLPDSGHEQISAVSADETTRDVLDLRPGEALLRIERVTMQAGRVIECRLTLLRSDRVAVISEWPGQSPVTATIRSD